MSRIMCDIFRVSNKNDRSEEQMSGFQELGIWGVRGYKG